MRRASSFEACSRLPPSAVEFDAASAGQPSVHTEDAAPVHGVEMVAVR